jgi:hypothetical protein
MNVSARLKFSLMIVLRNIFPGAAGAAPGATAGTPYQEGF